MGNIVKIISAAICAVLGFLFGHADGMLYALLAFMAIDYISGVIIAIIRKELSSEVGFKGIAKKIFMLMPGAVTANTPQRASYPIPYTKYVEFRQDISRSDYDSDEAYLSALTADLRAQAQEYVNAHQYPEVTYTVGAALEKLSDVGERVVVIDERMGLTLERR